MQMDLRYGILINHGQVAVCDMKKFIFPALIACVLLFAGPAPARAGVHVVFGVGLPVYYGPYPYGPYSYGYGYPYPYYYPYYGGFYGYHRPYWHHHYYHGYYGRGYYGRGYYGRGYYRR
jgi:hypothetical protein